MNAQRVRGQYVSGQMNHQLARFTWLGSGFRVGLHRGAPRHPVNAWLTFPRSPIAPVTHKKLKRSAHWKWVSIDHVICRQKRAKWIAAAGTRIISMTPINSERLARGEGWQKYHTDLVGNRPTGISYFMYSDTAPYVW